MNNINTSEYEVYCGSSILRKGDKTVIECNASILIETQNRSCDRGDPAWHCCCCCHVAVYIHIMQNLVTNTYAYKSDPG